MTPPATLLTRPWLEITVPSMTVGSITTSKVIVAMLPVAAAGIVPGVPLPGALISMPLTSADCVPESATVVPLSVVLPAT